MNLRSTYVCQLLTLALLCLPAMASLYAAGPPWFPFGPDGGDARAIAVDPHDHLHLYIGTTNGWLYETRNGGKAWSRIPTRVGQRDDLVLDSIFVDPADPNHLVVGGFHPNLTDGGLYVSHNAGSTWTVAAELKGQPVQALASAPSNPRILVAGSLSGVYRSNDGGDHWRLISPPGSTEIHEIESLAIDPKDPNVIYAGTWHLPWKTKDGGANWEKMHEGIIDDSDVFSIIVDPKTPSTIYLSACSGIYKSEDSGGRYIKVHGIPADARRTRKLNQDPQHLQTVFAGTTQGLYRTSDGGGQWEELTDAGMIVNDVYVDPVNPKHVLLATDHGGVMLSDDGGQNFIGSNQGFSARQVMTIAADPLHPATIYVGVVNDKDSGGVFLSFDGGQHWTQDSFGLNGADVRSLLPLAGGMLLAGTQHGIFRLDTGVWSASNRLEGAPAPKPSVSSRKPQQRMTPAQRRRAAALAAAAQRKKPTGDAASATVNDTVYGLASTSDFIFAATSSAVLISGTAGQSWRRVTAIPAGEWNFVAAAVRNVVVSQLKRIAVSNDDGSNWKFSSIPADLTQVSAVAVDSSGVIWTGGREGIFFSSDDGGSWHTLKNLTSNDLNDIHDIYFDAVGGRMLVTGNRVSTYGYAINLADKKVTQIDAGWNLRMLRPVQDHLIGATLYDGIVIQPRWVDSPVSGKW